MAALIWSAFPVVTRLGIDDRLAPSDITAIRFLVSGVLLLPVFLSIPRSTLRELTSSRTSMIAVALMAVGAGAPYILISGVGIDYAPASHFGIIVPSTMLVFSALGARLVLGEQIGTHTIVGNLVIIAGTVLIGWDSVTKSGYQAHYVLGDLLFLAAGLLWASYTVNSRRLTLNPFQCIALVSCLSLLFYTPFYLYVRGIDAFLHKQSAVLLQGVYQGVLSGVTALLLYTAAVRILGAAVGSVFGALVPGMSVVMVYLVLKEQPTAYEIGGLVVVTAGMLTALGRRRRRA